MSIRFALRQQGGENPAHVWPFGQQSTKGRLVLWDMEGSRKKVIVYLCSGGRYGCDGLNALYYEGAPIPEFDDDDNPNWVFHPGTRSTGWGDPVQGRPHFFPTLDFTFSGRSYVEVLLPEDVSGDPDEAPGEFEIYLRGLLVMDYSLDASGRLKEEGTVFSANNSLVGLYLLREGAKMPLRRFNRWGETWIDYKTVSDEELEWNDGTATHMVKRYDAHCVFTPSDNPLSAFETVMSRSPGCKYQDVNGALRILTTPDRAAVHTLVYDPAQTSVRSNIVKRGLSGSPRAPENIPNFWIFTYFDLLDERFKSRGVTVDYPELRDSADGILNQVGPLNLGLMTGSLAQRIARSTARLRSEQPFDRVYNVTGQYDSSHVAKNDNIDLVHKILGTTVGAPQLARVIRESYERKKGERKFTVHLTTPDYYRDTDHGPLED